MTIGNSLWIGVSGLVAHGEAMSTVGDNIANVSTIGFKRERASFNDVLGGEFVNQRAGGGVYLGANQTMWTQGTLQQTGNGMDVGLNGNGMFVVAGNHLGRDQQYLTRDGRFSMNASGTMVDQHGMRVQGYTVTNGVKSGTVGDLNLGGRQSPAIATTKASMSLNMTSKDVRTIPFDPTNKDSYNYQTTITVHDSLGAEHQVQMYFRNNGSGQYEAHGFVDGGELTGGTAGTPVEIGTASLVYNTDNSLQSQIGVLNANFKNATPGQAIQLNFGDDIASGGTGFKGSQFSANDPSTLSVDIDGRKAGSLTDVHIGQNGSIEGVFDNGDTFEVGRLAIAKVENDEGLRREGDSLYMATRESGQAVMDEAGVGGRGATMSGTLEQSNVDLSTELVTLIAYQRAFQANSKTVTTADEMLQEVTNLKR